MTKRKIAAILFGVAVASALGLAQLAPRATAETVAVSEGPVQERIVARAAVVAVDGVAEVRARDDGRVVRVHVNDGDAVEAGQVLAELDSGVQEAEVARLIAERDAVAATARLVQRAAPPAEIAALEAEMRGARVERERALQRAEREASLFARGASSADTRDAALHAEQVATARVESAEARVRLARAGGRPDEVQGARDRVAAAEAALAQARQRLERLRVVAPIAGVVIGRHADPGDTVVALNATLMFEIADATNTEIRAEIEEADCARVAVGLPVVLSTAEGEPVGRGRVVRVSPRVERREVLTDPARVRGDGLVRAAWIAWEQDPGLPLGQRLEAQVELPPRAVSARVPRAAVLVENGEARVEIASGWLREQRSVRLGAADREFVEVSGLVPGESVVVPGESGAR